MHAFRRIVSCQALPGFTLRVRFDDGHASQIDLSRLLDLPLYSALRDPVHFAQVAIDEETGSISWPCGADFDKDTLYRWSELGNDLVNQLTAATIRR